MGQKLRKLQLADFEQIWDFFQFFQFLTVLSTVFFGKLYAQITRTKLLNLLIFLDFKNYQPFSKYHTRKVKFRRFTCIRIGNERFAAKTAIIFSFGIFWKHIS